MAVPDSSVTIERISPTQVRISYLSDLGGAPTYYIWVNGVLDTETAETSHVLTIGALESPQVDIFDDPDARPDFYPDRATLQWDVPEDAAGYMVAEEIAAVYEDQQNLIAQGATVLQWDSRILEDDTTHRFRITPYDSAGNEGTARIVSVPMVRRPDAGEFTVSYLPAGANLRIEAIA